MKSVKFASIFAVSVLFFSPICFASSVCIVTWANGGYYGDGKARESIGCNKGNPDSKTVVEKDGDNDIPTVLAKLMAKGYKIVTETTGSYTLTK